MADRKADSRAQLSTWAARQQLLAMQKVVGSNPISRL
jgi:hypothetical protein